MKSQHTRCSEQDNLSSDAMRFHCSFDSEGNAHTRNRNQIVSTSMPDPRECVHFGVYAQYGTASTVLKRSAPGGGKAQIVGYDSKPMNGHEICEKIMCVTEGVKEQCEINLCRRNDSMRTVL